MLPKDLLKGNNEPHPSDLEWDDGEVKLIRMKGTTMKTIMTIGLAVAMLFFAGCGSDVIPMKHSTLIVTFSASPDTDETLIRNVLKIGGRLDCGYNSEYVKVLKNVDPAFELAAASNSNGSYKIFPAVLNWISSNGWKFQQKFCINMNDDNAEYYFVK